jgi:signal transduction histidine kinase/ligand-binding sensor domain-containing protein/DNA-binding response OmpR family regulator
MIYYSRKFSVLFTIVMVLLVFFSTIQVNAGVIDQIDAMPANIIRSDLLFERFYSSNGLADDRIRSIFQDSKGFLWVGTMNGLAEYDGYTFKKFYKKKQTNSISGNWVTSICEDVSHNLWIGTKEGLNKFDKSSEVFTDIKTPLSNSLSSNIINCIQFDAFGKLWIGTPKGLLKYDTLRKSFQLINKYPFNTKIEKIASSHGDFIWVTTNDGVVRYNVKTDQYQLYRVQVKTNPFGDRFWSLLEDNDNLYIATGGDGLIRLNFDRIKNNYSGFDHLNSFKGSKESLANTEIFDICKSSTGDFWLATGDGLAKIEKINTAAGKLIFYRNNPSNSRSLSNNQVFKVFIDKTNVLWAGTVQGLNKLDLYLLPFHYYTFNEKGTIDQVRSIFSTDGNIIWLGTSISGFYRYNTLSGLSNTYKFKPPGSFFNSTRSIWVDAGNVVWLGTLGGAIKMDQQEPRNFDIKIPGRVVFAILKDSKSNLWIGTNNGLYEITRDGKQINYVPDAGKPNSISSAFVRSIYEDHSGNIWLGFENSGIEKFNPVTGVFTPIVPNKRNEKVFGSIIYTILEYPENVIWAGSESGLNKISLKDNSDRTTKYSIRNYFEEDGLPDKSVNGMIADNSGNIWISTIKGLVKFNIANESFGNYLNGLNFNMSCYHKISDHQFLFGTTDGFVLFDPAEIKNDTNDPEVVLTNLKLFNKVVGIGKEYNGDVILNKAINNTSDIFLNYKNNQFTLEFTALHFSSPFENKYEYKLDGFDKDWVATNAADRSATYTNLDAGTYLFKVRAANYTGKWSAKPMVFKITIFPPPWKTWWALIIYFIIFSALFYLLIYYILLQARQRHQIHLEQVEKEQLKDLNQMKVRFFTDVSHEFRTPLSLIVGPIEDLLSSPDVSGLVRTKIDLVYRNCKKLLYLIEELMTFQKMEHGMLHLKVVYADISNFVRDVFDNFVPIAQRKGIHFNLDAELKECYLPFDPGKMEMVLNNLIFNAFKYSPEGGTIHIRLSTHDSAGLPVSTEKEVNAWFCISVEDNGKGISAEEFNHLFERFFSETTIKGTGVGLSLTKSLVELHQGYITAESEPGIKTSFKVYLPISDYAGNKLTEHYEPEYDVSMLIDEERPLSAITLDTENGKEPEYTILIVDDNPEVLNYLEILFQHKYIVAKAENGVKALEYVNDNEPDLIISDVMMPEMDGVALCEELKGKINTCHIPIILLTAKATVENKIDGLQIGADDYIPKPFHPNELIVRVEKMIENHKRIIEKYRTNSVIIPKNITTNPLDEAFVEKVINCIMKNMSNEEFSVEELGDMVAMSRSNLFRKLKAITGQTPIEFIYNIRLKHAMDLLLERKLNMSQIAYEVGFRNPSSFTKSFRKQYGKSPTEFLNDALFSQKG